MPPLPAPQYRRPPMGPRRASSITDLILRRGDIQAASAARSGAIWGNAVRDIGNIAAGAYAGHQQQKSEEERSAAIGEMIQGYSGDPQAFYRGLAVIAGPEKALAYTKAAVSLDSLTGQADEAEQQKLNDIVGGLANLDYDNFVAVYPGVKERAAPSVLAFGAFELPDEPTREFYEQIKQWGGGGGGEPYTLAPGAQRRSGDNELVAENPKVVAPRVPPSVIEEEAAARARGTESVVGPRREADAEKAARKGETSLRKEYQQQTKASIAGLQAIDRFSLKPFEKMQRGEELTPEDQFAMIYAFNKALDPTSVVREGEFRNTRQVGLGIHEQAFLLLEKWRAGAQLTQDQTQGMMEVIQGTKQTLQAQIEDQNRYFTGLSVSYGFDPENVIGGTRGYTGPETSGQATYIWTPEGIRPVGEQ